VHRNKLEFLSLSSTLVWYSRQGWSLPEWGNSIFQRWHPSPIRLGWKRQARTKTLAYFDMEFITAAKILSTSSRSKSF